MTSRKLIARPFQKWICKVIESIRENGKYDLNLKVNETVEEVLKKKAKNEK
jgi:prophage antirepressor-like protein